MKAFLETSRIGDAEALAVVLEYEHIAFSRSIGKGVIVISVDEANISRAWTAINEWQSALSRLARQASDAHG